MIEIPLTQGKVAIVDDEDAWALEYKWHYRNRYAQRRRRKFEQPGSIFIRLHQQIMGFPDCEVDHINGDTLDNRQKNLRLATHRQNSSNGRLYKNNTSGFKGVYWKTECKKWAVYIRVNGKAKHLGSFNTVKEAARVYDEAARQHYGEFACVNFPRPGEQGAREGSGP